MAHLTAQMQYKQYCIVVCLYIMILYLIGWPFVKAPPSISVSLWKTRDPWNLSIEVVVAEASLRLKRGSADIGFPL